MQRDYRADNIRFILVFLVVFSHLLEYVSGETADTLYRLVYTFHMSAFLFLTGYFARYSPRKIMLSLVWPYFLFQTIYKLFYGYVILETETVELTYTTPYWLLWYLMACVFCYLLIPMLQQKDLKERLAVLAGVTVLSLLAGLDKTVGYYMTLSRFFCYLPFFVAGYYAGHRDKPLRHFADRQTKFLMVVLCMVFLYMAERHILGDTEQFRRNVLYGSYSYEKESYAWTHRALLHLVGLAWTVLLFLLVPDKKIPAVSVVGGNTLPVFLFHGFLVRQLGKVQTFRYSPAENLALALVITVGILVLFGNPLSVWICKWFFTGHWLTLFFPDREGSRTSSGRKI